MEKKLMADSDQKMQDIHEYIFYVASIRNPLKLYSRISAHLLRCLQNPERKLERLKCPG